MKRRAESELLKTLRSMPLLYWAIIILGVALSLLYFTDDCLLRAACR
jgi:lipid-A-disaccharide synthase-like uncharacterized protein